MPELLAFIQKTAGDLKWWSLVHELGTSTVTYPHTHVAFESAKKLVSRSPRKFDYPTSIFPHPMVHPNIRMLTTQQYVERTWEYHEKDPILRLTSENSPVRQTDWLEGIRSSNSLLAAMKLAGIEPKTVACLVAMRRDHELVDVIPRLPGQCSSTLVVPENFQLIYLHGKTKMGKTRAALELFESPLLVSHLEDLKRYRADRHDGIVFDDICFTHLRPTECIHVLDWEMPRTINVKHGSVTLPAHVRKVVTSNLPLERILPVCDPEQLLAIKRRFDCRVNGQTKSLIIKITGILWNPQITAGLLDSNAMDADTNPLGTLNDANDAPETGTETFYGEAPNSPLSDAIETGYAPHAETFRTKVQARARMKEAMLLDLMTDSDSEEE